MNANLTQRVGSILELSLAILSRIEQSRRETSAGGVCM
jgi:hypothetical protein